MADIRRELFKALIAVAVIFGAGELIKLGLAFLPTITLNAGDADMFIMVGAAFAFKDFALFVGSKVME